MTRLLSVLVAVAALTGVLASCQPAPAAETYTWAGWGHSWLSSDWENTPGRHYRDLVALEDPAAAGFENHARSGWTAPDVAAVFVGARNPHRWQPGASGYRVVLHSVLNDLLVHGTRPAALAGAKAALRSMIVTAGAVTFASHRNPMFTWHGPWTVRSTVAGRAGTVAATRTPGATVTYRSPGLHHLHLIGHDNQARPGAVARISWPGGGKDSPTGGKHRQGSNHPDAPRLDHVNMVVTVPAPAGVPVTVTNVDGGHLWVNGVTRPSDTPPPVYLMVEQALPWEAWPGYHGSTRGLAVYNDLLRRVAAGFDHARVVDASPGWNPATMVGDDGLHANDHGMRHLADALLAKVAR